VFEAGGQRWGMDMGSDNYGLTNYFTQSLKFRYGYYRKSTAGHNTLTFDNDGLDNTNRGACDQEPGANGITADKLFVRILLDFLLFFCFCFCFWFCFLVLFCFS
jgi:hypothetical protein